MFAVAKSTRWETGRCKAAPQDCECSLGRHWVRGEEFLFAIGSGSNSSSWIIIFKPSLRQSRARAVYSSNITYPGFFPFFQLVHDLLISIDTGMLPYFRYFRFLDSCSIILRAWFHATSRQLYIVLMSSTTLRISDPLLSTLGSKPKNDKPCFPISSFMISVRTFSNIGWLFSKKSWW